MRRIVLVTVALAVLAPAASFARPAKQDVPDGKDCRDSKQVTVVTNAASFSYTDSAEQIQPSTEPERLAVCANQGGTTIFYFGGDMQSDTGGNGAGGTCGAVIVADQPVVSSDNGEDWSSRGPDDQWGTGDDHDC
ncbi:MAG: hypothetical protein WDA27_08955 [Actinomycetota bacterium]